MRPRPSLRPLLPAVLLALTAACFHRGRYVVTSERSVYTPEARFAVRVQVDDSIRVTVDSGLVIAPGAVPPAGRRRAIMRALTVEALLADALPPGMSRHASDGSGSTPPWRILAASAPRLLVDSLVLGVPARTGPLTFVLARPADELPRKSWIVFRIRGGAVATPATLADGTVLPAGEMRDGIRVYACADRTLRGARDRARARRMADDYLSAC